MFMGDFDLFSLIFQQIWFQKMGKIKKNQEKNKNEKQNVPILKVQRVEQNHYTYAFHTE